MKNGIGRQSIEERFGKDKLIKAYQIHETLRQAAKALGISHVALACYFKKENVPYKNRQKAIRIAKRRSGHTGVIAEFLSRNQSTPLPRDFTKLAFLAGTSRNAVSCYFYRRRRSLKKELSVLPNLSKCSLVVQDALGTNYNTKDFKSYEYLIDKFTLAVSLLVVLKNKEQVIIKIDNVESYIETVSNAL